MPVLIVAALLLSGLVHLGAVENPDTGLAIAEYEVVELVTLSDRLHGVLPIFKSPDIDDLTETNVIAWLPNRQIATFLGYADQAHDIACISVPWQGRFRQGYIAKDYIVKRETVRVLKQQPE